MTTTNSGLSSPRAVTFLLLWYWFSGCTLFMNKYIMGRMEGDATVLGTVQMLSTLVLGYVQMHVPCGMESSGGGGGRKRLKKNRGFYKHMFVVGTMRFLTVLFGLLALNYIPVSFTESIKSTAPIFTVLISYFLIGETTNLLTVLSLIPIMAGLAICSWGQVEFSLIGFIYSIATNLTECVQNVYSKYLISGDLNCSPAQLQFYTSVASMLVQIPVSYLLIQNLDVYSISLEYYLLNGVFFHFQSITAYVLMDYISPVTHSVANTVKRGFLIWCSVLLFHNTVTLTSGGGTLLIFIGVLLYNRARSSSSSEPTRVDRVGLES